MVGKSSRIQSQIEGKVLPQRRRKTCAIWVVGLIVVVGKVTVDTERSVRKEVDIFVDSDSVVSWFGVIWSVLWVCSNVW